MKIATITCHDVYNYGASLQAYALQEYMESQGHSYKIINYKPPYLSNHFRIDLVANPVFDKPVIKQLYLLAKLSGRLRGLKRKKLFDRFTEKYLHLSDKRYDSCENIANECPDADLYIAGSDQIWNTLFQNGRDAAFYLDFARGRGHRISYAASFATDKICNGAENFVKDKINNFDAISVRESSALNLLKGLGRNDGILVCDPVFLLDRSKWYDLAAHVVNRCLGEYIFLYDCEQSVKIKSIAKKLKAYTGLKICTVSATKGHYADENFELSGPIEFLNLLAGAKYVVANSFHALAFSLIFRKPFFIVNRTEGINTRMRDFLEYLSLSDRLIDSPDQLSFISVDYSTVEMQLDKLIAQSKQFLNEHAS